MQNLTKQLLGLLFVLTIWAAPFARAANEPDTFSGRVQALVDSDAKDASGLRSAFAGQFLSEIRQVSKRGLRDSKQALTDIIDAAKMLLISEDPADVLLGLRMLECVDYLIVVEISQQYTFERKEELPVDFVEQSVDSETVDILAQRREVDPKALLGHVLGMQGILQKELLVVGLDEEALIQGVRLCHLSDSADEQYDAVTQDLRYLDATPKQQIGDYLLLESLYLCDLQSDVALLYKAYAQHAEALVDQSSFYTWVKEYIAQHPSKRMLEGKPNKYVLVNSIALKLFFQKEPREMKFVFFGERMWPFISDLDEGHGLTPEEKATIQELVPGRSAR